MRPATNVPCPSASTRADPPTKLSASRIFPARSGWLPSTPESITATGIGSNDGKRDPRRVEAAVRQIPLLRDERIVRREGEPTGDQPLDVADSAYPPQREPRRNVDDQRRDRPKALGPRSRSAASIAAETTRASAPRERPDRDARGVCAGGESEPGAPRASRRRVSRFIRRPGATGDDAGGKAVGRDDPGAVCAGRNDGVRAQARRRRTRRALASPTDVHDDPLRRSISTTAPCETWPHGSAQRGRIERPSERASWTRGDDLDEQRGRRAALGLEAVPRRPHGLDVDGDEAAQ